MLTKLDNKTLEKWCYVWWILISDVTISMVVSEFNINKVKAWIHPAFTFPQAAPQLTWVVLLTMPIPSWSQCTNLQLAAFSRITHCAISNGFLNMRMTSLYSNGLQSTDLNPIELLWDVLEICKSTVWCHHVNMDQNIWGMFPASCWMYATNN